MAARARKHPRRKAKQERARQTVDAILEGAAQVLLREGYARATTNRIAERAGVSVGTLYQYFDGKEDAFEALIRRQTALLVDAITSDPPDPSRRLEEVLRELLMLGLRASPHGPELFRRLEQVPNAALRKAVAEGRRGLIRFVRDVLEGYRDRLRVDDLDRAADLLVSAAEGAGINAPQDRFDERLVDELTAMFARYLMDDPAD